MADPRPRLLLIEDDPPLRRSLVLMLLDEGFDALEAACGRDGLDQLHCAPDAVLLDLGLPDVDGFELCQQLRARTSAPIVVLTAQRDDDSRDRALAAGADDFLSKPFAVLDLARRLRALVAPAIGQHRSLGPFQLDVQRSGVTWDGRRIPLSRIELRLLVELAVASRAVTADVLLRRVWGLPPVAGAAALHARVLSLNAKLEGRARITASEGDHGLQHELQDC